ncbi:MAG: transposase [Chloroflexi bacterium]|nr:transposase [Chloroflexota bacterium]
MSSKRRRFPGELKAKVVLEALPGERRLQEIASQYQVHPNQVGAWKRQAVEGLAEVFSKGAERRSDKRSIDLWAPNREDPDNLRHLPLLRRAARANRLDHLLPELG